MSEKSSLPSPRWPALMGALVIAAASLAACSNNPDDGKVGMQAETAAPPAATPARAPAYAASADAHDATAANNAMDGLSASQFVAKAATGGLEEVTLADVALSKSTNADVIAFAHKMQDDHGKANAKLKALAADASLAVPVAMTAEQEAKVSQLKAAGSTQFDAAYADAMVKAHQATIDLFQRAANSLPQGALQQFASDTLPTLHEHLRMAQTLQAKMSGTGGAAGTALGAL